jgi:hypothetical protein
MAPPVPLLPEIAGTLALSFTGAPAETPPPTPPTPSVQRPAVPAAPADSAPAPAPPPTEGGVPRPPTLPDLPGASTDAGEPPATPVTVQPPQPEPTAPTPDVVAEFPDPAAPAVDDEPFEMPERNVDPKKQPSTGLLAPSDKRFFFDLFAGGTKALRGGYSYGYFSSTDFKIEGAIGGHSKARPTLGGAAVLQTSFGLLKTITVGPRVQWDKPLVPTHALFSQVTLSLAYRAAVLGYYGFIDGFANGTYHSALFGVGWGVRAIVADRLSLTFRPVNVSLAGPAPGIVQIDWDVFGGIGVVW